MYSSYQLHGYVTGGWPKKAFLLPVQIVATCTTTELQSQTLIYLKTYWPLTRLEHPTVDVLWRPEIEVYQHNNVVSHLKIIAGVKLGLIMQRSKK